ncbi:ion channel [Ketobacter sp.]|uniref:ion channel n=1 Tax=Ketobacter sp. TaxID=2083498 RepID=UPI000F103E41|nr:ion channel [Ketobacter sp.]RLU01785.1 MAG: potassium channel protein [Ketobacter sp.]
MTADDRIVMLGLFLSYMLLVSAIWLGVIALWISLIVICGITAYFSFTFFRSSEHFGKFLYFVLYVFLLIAYLALIYKLFGIVDTSTNEEIKPSLLNAAYFSVVTWTTLGYGDFRPIDQLKPFVMAEDLMGYIFMALLVSKVLYMAQKR